MSQLLPSMPPRGRWRASLARHLLPGNCPFRASVHPSGKFVYVANRTGESYLVSAYIVNAVTGALTSVAGSPFAMDGAGITVDPSGRFAYVERPGIVSVYAIDAVTGALTAIPGAQFAVVDRAGEMAVIRIAQ